MCMCICILQDAFCLYCHSVYGCMNKIIFHPCQDAHSSSFDWFKHHELNSQYFFWGFPYILVDVKKLSLSFLGFTNDYNQEFQRGFSLVYLHYIDWPRSPSNYIPKTSKFLFMLLIPFGTHGNLQLRPILFWGQRLENMCSFHWLQTKYWKTSRGSAREINTLRRVLLSDW